MKKLLLFSVLTIFFLGTTFSFAGNQQVKASSGSTITIITNPNFPSTSAENGNTTFYLMYSPASTSTSTVQSYKIAYTLYGPKGESIDSGIITGLSDNAATYTLFNGRSFSFTNPGNYTISYGLTENRLNTETVVVSGSYTPAQTKYVTAQPSPNYSDSSGYSGTLSSYLASGSYTPAQTKYVTAQPSPNYSDSSGYTGTLSSYLASETYIPPTSKTVSQAITQSNANFANTIPYSDSSGYSGTLSKKGSVFAKTTPQTISKYVTYSHTDYREDAWIYWGTSTTSWKNSDFYYSFTDGWHDGNTVWYNDGTYSGNISLQSKSPVTRIQKGCFMNGVFNCPKSYNIGGQYTTWHDVQRYNYGGYVYGTQNVTTYSQVYAGTVTNPGSDTKTYLYQGTVTKPAVDTRVNLYQGTVTKPAVDTRVYGTIQVPVTTNDFGSGSITVVGLSSGM